MADERFGLNIVDKCLDVACSHAALDSLQFFFCRNIHALSLRQHHHHYAVVVANELLNNLIDCSHRNALRNHAHSVIFIFDARDWLVIQEVLYIFINQVARILLLAVVVGILELRHVFVAGTQIFAVEESELLQTGNLGVDGFISTLHVVVLGKGCESECILCLGNEEVAAAHACIRKLGISLLRDFAQTSIHHLGCDIKCVHIAQICHVVLERIGERRIFIHHLHD